MQKLVGLFMVASMVLFIAFLLLTHGIINIDHIAYLVSYGMQGILISFVLAWLVGGLYLVYKKSGATSFPDTRKKPPKRPPGADSTKSSEEPPDAHIGVK